jgi:uncharacterized protein (TIGR03086 family)
MASEEADITVLDRRAVELSERIVAKAQSGDLGRPTPCAGWTLRDLLEHMITQHYGFAAASRGEGADPRFWQSSVHENPIAAYAAASEHVLAAFAAPGVRRQSFVLPEISPDLRFPATMAISFHFVDYVAHGWDVARTLDVPFDLPADVAAAAFAVAREVPDGPERQEQGAAFRPGLPAAEGSSVLDQALMALGRSPSWPG